MRSFSKLNQCSANASVFDDRDGRVHCTSCAEILNEPLFFIKMHLIKFVVNELRYDFVLNRIGLRRLDDALSSMHSVFVDAIALFASNALMIKRLFHRSVYGVSFLL